MLLVGADELARMGLASLVSRSDGATVVAEAAGAAEAVEAARRVKPDLVVRDGVGDEQESARFRELARAAPESKTLVIGNDDPIEVQEAFASGAAGFLLRSNVPDQLARALEAVAGGTLFLDPQMGGSLAAQLAADARGVLPAAGADPGEAPLTLRERQVLTLLSRGLTSGEIAARLRVSLRTVDRHRTSLGKKLHRRRRSELVAYAREHHLD